MSMAEPFDLEVERARKAALREAEAAARRKAKAASNGHDPGGWQDELTKGEKGKPHASLNNAVIALRRTPEWVGVFAWNDFSARPEIMRPLPGSIGRLTLPRALADADISVTTIWLQRAEIMVQSRTTAEAIRLVADDTHFHPVRDYLNGVTWDRMPRLDMWLADHLGAADTPLNRAFASRWMIGMVARVMVPGCQLDAALIFESRQGLGKSTTLRALGGEWFTDHLPDLTSKDAMQQLQGVWIVEIAELDSIRRAETHRIKSFISAQVDRFRPPFGMLPADFPRQCGFAGTVNPGGNGYLRDETGARRFWTVACGDGWPDGRKVDTKALAKVRDQLWAEASARYRAGQPWHLDTAELEAAQASAAEDRQEDDPRERKIRAFIQGRSSVHMDEILGADCLQVPVERWSRALRTEIGFVMSTLKWRRYRVRSGATLEWKYQPPP